MLGEICPATGIAQPVFVELVRFLLNLAQRTKCNTEKVFIKRLSSHYEIIFEPP